MHIDVPDSSSDVLAVWSGVLVRVRLLFVVRTVQLTALGKNVIANVSGTKTLRLLVSANCQGTDNKCH